MPSVSEGAVEEDAGLPPSRSGFGAPASGAGRPLIASSFVALEDALAANGLVCLFVTRLIVGARVRVGRRRPPTNH